MSTTLDDFFNAQSLIENKGIDQLREELDPFSYLNIKFSIEEAQGYRDGKRGQALSIEEQIKAERQKRIADLKAKSKTALQTRIAKFNEALTWFKDYRRGTVGTGQGDDWYSVKSLYDERINSTGSSFVTYLIENNPWGRLQALDNFKNRFNAVGVYEILLKCFPTVYEVEYNPSAYPHLIDYMENVPWPTPEQFDMAVKNYVGWGTDDYAKHSYEFLKAVHAKNMNPSSEYNYYFVPEVSKYFYSGFGVGESTYGYPTMNPSYSYDQMIDLQRRRVGNYGWIWDMRQWPDSAKNMKSYDMSVHYWSARPKEGYVYIHKIGYINPYYFTQGQIYHTYSSYGWGQEIIRMNERASRRSGSILGGGFSAIGKVLGETLKITNPIYIQNSVMRNVPGLSDVFREVENLTGGFFTQVESVTNLPSRALQGEPISEKDWMEALDLGIKVALVVATGGSAMALIGAASSQLQRGTLGKTELGRHVLTAGEIIAASAVAGSSISKAASKVAEKEAMKIAAREVGNATDLNESVVGNIVLQASLTAGQHAYHGSSIREAITESIKKGTLVGIANENPVLGLVASAGLAMYNNPSLKDEIDVNDPESAYDSFSWEAIGGSLKEFAESLDSAEIKRLIGLAILAASGRVSTQSILDSFARDLSMKHINKFHNDEPVKTFDLGPTKEEQDVLAGVEAAKSEINLLTKVSKGHIPSPSELKAISRSEVANYIDRMIAAAVPDGAKGDAFKNLFDIGLPDIDLSINLGIEVPDWAKIQKIDMPEWAQISGQEDWVKALQKGFDDLKESVISKAQWEDLLSAYLKSLWPPHMPLRPVGDYEGKRNYIDTKGYVSVRRALDYSYLHPMITAGHIQHKKTSQQLAYENARDLELQKAREYLASLDS